RNLRWRGVALDQFTGRAWNRTPGGVERVAANERNLYQLGTTEHLSRLTAQTFFLEPIDTPVLFAAPRAVAVQGALPFVRRDREGALTTELHPRERLTYRAYSDTVEPDPEVLRRDDAEYAPDKQRYLNLPRDLNTEIGSLTHLVVDRYAARTRYDKARAVESYLNTEFGYTLDMKSGGADPLSDFLFRVREGHCEYFSTAMAVMLRTQGIAARVVNGFQTGEYNESADAYIVRQSHAHSWVEVYFPETDAWVTFDPTPPAGRAGTAGPAGLAAKLGEYAEALELFWIQYVVAYDRQEQRTLANSIGRRWRDYRRVLGATANSLASSLGALFKSPAAEGGRGSFAGLAPKLVVVVASVVLVLLLLRRLRVWAFGRGRQQGDAQTPGAEVRFYRRLTDALEARGLRRDADQTPLEFADATGLPEAVNVTRAYHRVRYGARALTPAELAEVEENLKKVEGRELVNSES
ncbi:MAG TPA: transglutaminaseTgpA domain-containing protein, partial [Pyrinomonadaceae bacterium]|nr:transglutaminaseTgpA domain-containing protein [Pyrinomonadaceae bacterium]